MGRSGIRNLLTGLTTARLTSTGGMKADAYEGGHRIPFIVRWPAKTKAAGICDETINLTGLLATCSDITGKKLAVNEGEDSFSILPLMLGKTGNM